MRHDDWESALDAAIGRHRGAPFAWGPSDCFSFAIDCAVAVAGQDDPRGTPPPRYDDKRSAVAALRARGHDSVGDWLGKHYAEIAPSFAQRGDLALVIEDRGITVAVFVGAMLACKGEQGIAFIARARAVRAFRVD